MPLGPWGNQPGMMRRRIFLATLAGVAFAPPAGLVASRAETTESSGSPMTAQARRISRAVDAIVAAQLVTRIVRRAPARFPAFVAEAYYVGRTDPEYPDQAVIWINPDHPELVSPRHGHLGDDTPLLVELLLASADLHLANAPDVGLRALDPVKRRAAAVDLAGQVTVVAQFTAYPAVDEGEFAARAFAFAVIRHMTRGIDGVAALPQSQAQMAASGGLAFYAGRIREPGVPAGWGVVFSVPVQYSWGDGGASYVRAFVLATADRQPPGSSVKIAYDAAAAEDAANHSGEARNDFAAPYVAQVQALSSR